MKSVVATLALAVAVASGVFAQRQARRAAQGGKAVEQEVLRAEQEERDAYVRRDAAAVARMVADEFVMNVPDGLGTKATLLAFLRETPADPSLTLTSEGAEVHVDGDTAVVAGRRVERRRRADNNQEGVAYARYTRTYVRRGGRWLLLAEQLQPVAAEPVAVKVDTSVYGDYVGKYDSPVFAFAVRREGDKLIAVPEEKIRPASELLPESEAEFFLPGRDAYVTFIRDRKGQVSYALLRIRGVDIRAKKIG